MAQHFCKLLAVKQFLHFYFLTNFMSAFSRTDPELVEDISFFASSEFLYFYLFILLIIIVNRFGVFTRLLFGAKNQSFLPPQPLLLHHRVLSYQPLVRGENFQNCAAASICCKIDKKNSNSYLSVTDFNNSHQKDFDQHFPTNLSLVPGEDNSQQPIRGHPVESCPCCCKNISHHG